MTDSTSGVPILHHESSRVIVLHHNRGTLKARETGDNGWIIREHLITAQLLKVGKDRTNVIQGVGPVPRHHSSVFAGFSSVFVTSEDFTGHPETGHWRLGSESNWRNCSITRGIRLRLP
jgi:hypothetical protein